MLIEDVILQPSSIFSLNNIPKLPNDSESDYRRASKIPNKLHGLDYEERIKAWGIPKLSDRRIRENLIQMYNLLNNLDEINWYKGPNLATNPNEKRSTSGNQHSLLREHFPSKLRNDVIHFVTVRHEFFTNQVTLEKNI